MGGNAFASQSLSTPRMSPKVYFQVKEQVLTILRQHYKYAGVPVERPAKIDHGDIDVLVAEPSSGRLLAAEDLSLALNAQHHLTPKGSPTTHFALRWPDNISSDETSAASISQTQEYIQLDLHVLPDQHAWSWLLFNQAYGDLWPILGSTLRRYGLTLNDQAFWVNIPELGDEGSSKKLRRVKITDNSSEVLKYFELDESEYWSGFESWTALCEYAASVKFHNPARGKPKNQIPSKEVEEARDKMSGSMADKQEVDEYAYDITEALRTMPGAFPVSPTASSLLDETSGRSTPLSSSSTENNDTDAKTDGPGLKSDDRRRVRKRPLFAYFVDTYLPSHTDDSVGSGALMSRAEVVEDLKTFFGADFQERYDIRASHAIRVTLGDKLWAEMREYVQAQGVSGRELGFAMKGLKRGCGALPDKVSQESSDETAVVSAGREAWSQADLGRVKKWCTQNWQGMADRERGMEKGMEGLRLT